MCSVTIDEISSHGTILSIRHLVLDGSSQWVVGRNLTSRKNILQFDANVMIVPGAHNISVNLPLFDHELHIYL